MAKITAADAVQATISELTKEGNKVAKTEQLPPGRHAEKGYDVQSFNSGMRYAMQKISTALKRVNEGRFTMPEPSSTGKATKVPTAKKAPAKKAPAKKTTKAPAAKKSASITSINEARAAVATDLGTPKRVVRR